METDRSAVGFNSSPLYRFILQEGKFKGVEFYFKNVFIFKGKQHRINMGKNI